MNADGIPAPAKAMFAWTGRWFGAGRTTLCALTFLQASFAVPAGAQGFAGLGSAAEGFALPDPAVRLDFPADDGPHADFRIEWWYVTATLADTTGTPFGIQWTLFRTALRPGAGQGWDSPQVWMAHAAATSSVDHRFAERFARGGTGQAGAAAAPFEAWLDDWSLAADPDNPDRLRLTARGDGFTYDLTLTDTGPRVLHGASGYSVKSPEGQASHYYSRPFLQAAGDLTLEGRTHALTGTAWLDHEWSSQPLSGTQAGWDWIGLALDGGARVMAARVRSDAGATYFGTWIDADGTAAPLGQTDLTLTPVNRTDPPTRWRLDIPSRDISLTLSALNPRSWTGTTVRYWEGPVDVTGTQTGRGYLEMTGSR